MPDDILIFAHRGGKSASPRVAEIFQQAQITGADIVETDVRTSLDGVPLLVHDRIVEAKDGSSLVVARNTYNDLVQALEPGSILALGDALRLFPDLKLNVDIKDWASVKSVPPLIEGNDASMRVSLASFSDLRLFLTVRKLTKRPKRSLGVGMAFYVALAAFTFRPIPLPLLPDGVWAAQVPWKLVGNVRLPHRYISYCHNLGIQVHVWTVNDEQEMEAALLAGVDGLVTDLPKEALALVKRWNSEGRKARP